MRDPILNASGVITIDFLFALIIAFGMSAIVFSLTFTLSVVEITQYIVYSTSRAHSAANYDPGTQEQVARKKYESLIKNPAFANLYQNGWFEISKPQEIEVKQGGAGGNFSADYPSIGAPNREVFQGVRTKLTAKMLELKLPFLGKITPDDDGFSTKVGAVMLRESTFVECTKYMKDRVQRLWNIRPEFAHYQKTSHSIPWEDNGC